MLLQLVKYIILIKSEKLSYDLRDFAETGQAYFARSQSDRQAKDTFSWYAILFINWLSAYKLQRNKEVRDSLVILIVDGHKSRECSIGIKLSKNHNIDLFIIPTHTSHVTHLLLLRCKYWFID